MTPETITLESIQALKDALQEASDQIGGILIFSQEGLYSPEKAAQRINTVIDNLRALAQ